MRLPANNKEDSPRCWKGSWRPPGATILRHYCRAKTLRDASGSKSWRPWSSYVRPCRSRRSRPSASESTSAAYAAAFACFGPVAARADPKQEATLRCAFWHKVGRNGCHEDFHNLLFVADACYLANAILNAATCR